MLVEAESWRVILKDIWRSLRAVLFREIKLRKI